MENKDWNTRSSFSSVSTRESTIVTYFDKEATSDPIFSKLDVLEFSVKLIPRWHCYVCVQKCRSKPPFLSLSICETVHTTPHKNAQKRKFTNKPFKVDTYVNGGMKKRSRSVWTDRNWGLPIFKGLKLQKRIFFPPLLWVVWTHKKGYFYLDFCAETEQCERLKDIYRNG